MNKQLLSLAEETVNLLKQKNLKISCAESCTGGMITSYLTSVSGVSNVFELGICAYSCRIKSEVLKVNPKTLKLYGAVSKNTALEMAENIRKISDSDIGVAVTGVAGPDRSEGHPMGYVFIALADNKKTTVKLLNIEPLDRNFVRENATLEIFQLIKNYIKEKDYES